MDSSSSHRRKCVLLPLLLALGSRGALCSVADIDSQRKSFSPSAATSSLRGSAQGVDIANITAGDGNIYGGNANIERRAATAVPRLVGAWKKFQKFPVDTGESQGMLVGCDLISIGGFFENFASGPRITYALDLCNPGTASWRELAMHPIEPFLTHAAHAHKGDNLLYLCGGYRGVNRGPSITDCHVFDKTDGPEGSWRALPSLPQRRGAGGMIYIQEENKLMFTLGAVRSKIDRFTTSGGVDKNNTWTLDLGEVNLDDPTSGAQWKFKKGGSPYLGNHVTSITAKDCSGKTHYYFLGGQVGELELTDNIDEVWEYIPATDKFVQRQSMPEPRGHFTTANALYGCGFITVGGSKNQDPAVSDEVLYYDIDSDTWTEIGKYPEPVKTPVCGIVSDVLYCSGGYTIVGWKIKLSFPTGVVELPRVLMDYDFTDTNDFVYADNLFRDSSSDGQVNNRHAGGWWQNGILGVWLGGGTSDGIVRRMSGGHEITYNLLEDANVQLRFRYHVRFLAELEAKENLQVLCSVNGVLYGLPGVPNDNIDLFKGVADLPDQTPWFTVTVDLGTQRAGEQYTLALGGYLSMKDEADETVWIMFDDVFMTADYL